MNLNLISNPGLLCVGLLMVLVIAWAVGLVATLSKGRAATRQHRERMGQALAEVRIDEMTAKNFRLYIMSVLAQQGYQTQLPPPADDLGTELLGRHAARRCCIEVIHYTKPLTAQSVRMAVENRLRLGYDEAMVITNSTFGDEARQLAAAEHCTLIDRDDLAEWILQMQVGRPQRDLRGY